MLSTAVLPAWRTAEHKMSGTLTWGTPFSVTRSITPWYPVLQLTSSAPGITTGMDWEESKETFESRTTKHCSCLTASTKDLPLPQQRRLWPSHNTPLHSYFKWLPSGVRLSSPSCRTNRHRDTTVPSFITLFNENIKRPSSNESELDPQ